MRYSYLAAFLLWLMLLLYESPGVAGEIWVIARQDAPVSTLPLHEAANIFLGRGTPFARLMPVDQDNDTLRSAFYRAIADLSLKSLRAYWAKQVFTGRGHPPPLLTEEAAVQAVLDNPQAVTFVLANRQPTGTKVLLFIDTGSAP